MLISAREGYIEKYNIGLTSFQFKSFTNFTIFGLHVQFNRVYTLMLFGVVLIAAFFLIAFRRPKLVPGKLQWVAEEVYNFVRDGIAGDVIGPRQGLRFAPYLTVLFCFVFVNNFFEILPLAQLPVNSHFAFPFFLAVITWFLYNIVGIAKKGFFGYFKSVMIPPGVPRWMIPIIAPLEFVSRILLQPFTLAVRLFANMFAGHLLLLVFFTGALYLLDGGLHEKTYMLGFSFVSFLVSILLTFFELIIIALQAYIFVILTTVYVSESLAEEH